MNKILVGLFAVLAIALLGGCGKSVKRGVVTEKWYEPERHYVTCHYISHGKYGGHTQCINHFDDEDFMVRVSDVEGAQCFMEEEKLGSRESWDFVQVGDSFYRDTLNQIHFLHNR